MPGAQWGLTDKLGTVWYCQLTFRVHYIPYPLPRFFCRLSIVPLDMDNGTFNSSHTDVVEKVNFVVPASQHGGTSVARGQKWLCFGHFSRGDPFLLIFSKTKF